MNKRMVLIAGKSTSGKTASLRNIKNPEGVMYLNCESGKDLPFRFKDKNKKFKSLTVTDPYQIYQAIEEAENMPEVHTIVIDTLTYLMTMYETMYVSGAANGQKAWGQYAEYFKKLHLFYFAKSTKTIVVLAHVLDVYNEVAMSMDTLVKIKGSVMNEGVESYYSTVIATKKVPTKDLVNFSNPMLTISAAEERLKFKHVYQTQLTDKTVGERIRANMGMWDENETYIDNDIQHVLDRLHEYYE